MNVSKQVQPRLLGMTAILWVDSHEYNTPNTIHFTQYI